MKQPKAIGWCPCCGGRLTKFWRGIECCSRYGKVLKIVSGWGCAKCKVLVRLWPLKAWSKEKPRRTRPNRTPAASLFERAKR